MKKILFFYSKGKYQLLYKPNRLSIKHGAATRAILSKVVRVRQIRPDLFSARRQQRHLHLVRILGLRGNQLSVI
jgi:hypothetical protein